MTVARIVVLLLFSPLFVLFAATPPPGGYTVYAVPHSHIDIEWFWTYDRTQSIAITNLRQALLMLRKDPRYAFVQVVYQEVIGKEGPGVADGGGRRVCG